MIGHAEVPSRLPNKDRHFPLMLIWQSWAPLQGLPQLQSHPSQDCGLCGQICIQRRMRPGYKGSLNHFIQQGTTLQAIVAPELPGKGTKLLPVSIVPLTPPSSQPAPWVMLNLKALPNKHLALLRTRTLSQNLLSEEHYLRRCYFRKPKQARMVFVLFLFFLFFFPST